MLRCSRMHSSDSFSRRTFLAATSGLALARGASSKDRLRAGLVGCGGRGTQAVVNLLTGNENVDLVAMAGPGLKEPEKPVPAGPSGTALAKEPSLRLSSTNGVRSVVLKVRT